MSTPQETSQEGIKADTKMQLDRENLKKETIVDIKDMIMGEIKNGKPVGKSTIQHIEVPGVLNKGAEYFNKTLKYAGVALTVASVTIDIWEIGSAIKDDVFVWYNANEIILQLEDAIKKLKKTLLAETDKKIKREISDTTLHLEKRLRDVRRAKKAPIETIRMSASALGEWGGGAVGAAGAATAISSAISFLPALPFVAICGPIVTVAGAIGFGIVGGIAGSEGGEKIAEVGLTILDE